MPTRLILLLALVAFMPSCSGDRHLPPSNPPEYDPKKVYTAPTPSPPAPPQPVAQSPKPESLPAPLPAMDAKALQRALETADRTRAILERVGSIDSKDSKAQIHAALEALMSGEQASPELRPSFKELFEPRKKRIHQALDKEYEQLQKAFGEPATIQPQLRKSDRSVTFPVRQVAARSKKAPLVPWVHLLQGPGGMTVSLEPDCCGAWHIATIPSNVYDGEGFGLEMKTGGRYWPDNDHVGEGDAIVSTTKVAVGDKMAIQVKLLKKNRGVVNRCPSAAGRVPGDASLYEEMGYSVSSSTISQQVGIFIKDQAKTIGQTDEEGRVQEIRLDVTASDLDGETGQVLRQTSGTAVKRRGSPISCSGCDQRTTEAAKRLGNLISWIYYNAEQKWNNPPTRADACVRIHFVPATKTVTVSPGKSREVRAELRAVTGEEGTKGRLFEVQELRNGKATPTEAKTTPEEPAVFTFTAPHKKCSKSEAPGFRVFNSSSRAGRAGSEEWELKCGLRLRIENRIQADPQSNKSKMGMAQFDGVVQFDIPLEQFAEGWFRGEVNVVRPMVVHHVRPAANPCSGTGSQTEHWIVAAHVDPKTESMAVQFGFTTSNEQASWTCRGPAGTFTDELYVDLFGILESVNMPTKTGIKKDFNARNQEFLEWLSVEVVEGLD